MFSKVALTGVGGSGKDYLAEYLMTAHGFRRVSFSDQLKKIGHSIFPWLELDYPPLVKEEPLNITTAGGVLITKSPREIWIALNALREVDDNLFLDMASKEASEYDKVIISDIRPDNELQWCKDNGYTVIYVKPAKQLYEPNEFDKATAGSSERESKCHYTFVNNFNGLDEFKQFCKDKGIT